MNNSGLTQINASELSRRTATTGNPSRSGSLGAVTQYTSGAEIIRMPSGSIVSIPPLERSDLPKPRFNEALALALSLKCVLWVLFALLIRALFF